MAFKVKITSKSGNTRKRLSNIVKGGMEGAQEGMNDFAKDVKDRSQQLVPRDTGALHDSAYAIGKNFIDTDAGNAAFVSIRQAQLNSKKGPQAEVGYAEDYATKVHEDLQTVHTIGQAKFLEQAERELRAKLSKGVASQMSTAMKKV